MSVQRAHTILRAASLMPYDAFRLMLREICCHYATSLYAQRMIRDAARDALFDITAIITNVFLCCAHTMSAICASR